MSSFQVRNILVEAVVSSAYVVFNNNLHLLDFLLSPYLFYITLWNVLSAYCVCMPLEGWQIDFRWETCFSRDFLTVLNVDKVVCPDFYCPADKDNQWLLLFSWAVNIDMQRLLYFFPFSFFYWNENLYS